ncbi:putative urea ABC transporter substrate-binding protein [Marinospirillum sp.]|uniref:putative urea ABC transporter substrate-binding protein n=1 Tax=Marinospirillum sp. TaxID=2183934 RepID=UPI0028709B63|nr:putative urea ABC transporter substrate-binding protein [Marinospirillum sp.]MDR9469361.1 putative urea ABC transporter substrate-binding protein [Marinospirillum sp.]
MKRLTASLLALALGAGVLSSPAHARSDFSICWSIYVGWMPWGYAEEQGIVQKWADKYDINIDVVQINDYIESINQYSLGQFDGCSMTNMDALTIPAAGGVDSTAMIVGDFSNGNDGVLLKGEDELEAIRGQEVNLVELSVSHYLLARGLETVGMTERDITVVNTSDADLVAAASTPSVTAVTTWNPLLNEILSMPDTNLVFDSSQIPGEIIDLLVVNTETLEAYPELGKALAGAWYETMTLMSSGGEEEAAARTWMAEASGTDLEGYELQLGSTEMFYQAGEAVDFTLSKQLPETMRKVAGFSFKHGLLGEGAPDADFIGIKTPAGLVGSANNVQLRFNPEFMQLAADGKL